MAPISAQGKRRPRTPTHPDLVAPRPRSLLGGRPATRRTRPCSPCSRRGPSLRPSEQGSARARPAHAPGSRASRPPPAGTVGGRSGFCPSAGGDEGIPGLRGPDWGGGRRTGVTDAGPLEGDGIGPGPPMSSCRPTPGWDGRGGGRPSPCFPTDDLAKKLWALAPSVHPTFCSVSSLFVRDVELMGLCWGGLAPWLEPRPVRLLERGMQCGNPGLRPHMSRAGRAPLPGPGQGREESQFVPSRVGWCPCPVGCVAEGAAVPRGRGPECDPPEPSPLFRLLPTLHFLK